VSALETRLEALREQDADLADELAPQAATSPDAAELAAVADNLETTIATAEPRQAKALLRLLIKDIRVNARSEILPTYRIVTPEVSALPSSVERTGIEPVTSGLQTHPITRPHPTPTDRIGMTEPNSAIASNVIRHRSTAVRSHRARTAAA
jgi:hypothetical protein